MLGVRPKNDATNRYRTDKRISYLSSDKMMKREKLGWERTTPQKDSGQKKKKAKNKN